MSAVDLDEETEDMEALAELERADEGSNDNDAAEEEDEVSKQRSLLTLTLQLVTFCLYKLQIDDPILSEEIKDYSFFTINDITNHNSIFFISITAGAHSSQEIIR